MGLAPQSAKLTSMSASPRSGARYGSSAPAKSSTVASRALVIILIAVVAAAVIYAFQFFRDRNEVNAQITYVTHEVRDDETLRIWTDVTRNRPDEAAYCIVQAYDYAKAEVGRREFAVPADGRDTFRVAVDVPTNHRAVAGGVYGCSGEIPPYLDVDNPDYAESN